MKKTVVIEGFTEKGAGYARLDSGKKITISNSVPSDVLEVDCRSKNRKGRILTIKTPSPMRTEPICEHASICGGCSWQQITYSSQLDVKQSIIKKHFGSAFPKALISLIVACEPPWHYRNKMEFSFSENAKKVQYLGLVMTGGSHFVFNVKKCYLAPLWFSEVLTQMQQWLAQSCYDCYHIRTASGLLRTLTLREGGGFSERLAMITIDQEKDLSELVPILQHLCPNILVRVQKMQKGVPTSFSFQQLIGKSFVVTTIEVLGKIFSFKVSATAFFQPNTKQAAKIYELVLSFIKPQDFVVDLYAGTGTITTVVAALAKKVVGVEIQLEAVLDARENFQRNGCENATMLHGDAAVVLQTIPTPDVLIVDPPRSGLSRSAIETIVHSNAKKLVYISCNPYTQVENITQLETYGYRLMRVMPVDQFPQTHHIENIAYLEKDE